ncbi:hypothetical protein H0H87_007138 [Tephrocybe sp. NHM501043]|nr:hypothetical protein H0H87_007138 [Tephrocybe sp. NHM501043]
MEGEATQRGIKRKRYEPPPQDLGVKIGGKLHHGLKEVKKAAKKAKTFETQKFIKKLKELRNKSETSDEVKETERQLELLKELDHELVATTALRTKLNKLRIVGENEHVRTAIFKEFGADVTPAIPGTNAAKVQSRLLSSKLLAVEIATVVKDLKNVIQPPTVSEPVEEDATTQQRPPKMKNVEDKEPQTMATIVPPSFVDSQGEQELEENVDLDDAGWESGTVDEDGAEGQDGLESGSLNGDEDDTWGSAKESDDDEEELAVPPAKKSKSAPVTTKATAKHIGMQSTFLPSLSVGFTRGDSDDSDLSESEAKVADIDIKKNRRGQRARRVIWEKKFGKNANHKKKEAEAIAKRPPPNRHSNKSTGRVTKVVPQYRQEADAGWGQRAAAANRSTPRPAPMARSVVKARVEEKPMHPSWEAKRRLKEKESVGIVPSQGKKIKF